MKTPKWFVEGITAKGDDESIVIKFDDKDGFSITTFNSNTMFHDRECVPITHWL